MRVVVLPHARSMSTPLGVRGNDWGAVARQQSGYQNYLVNIREGRQPSCASRQQESASPACVTATGLLITYRAIFRVLPDRVSDPCFVHPVCFLQPACSEGEHDSM